MTLKDKTILLTGGAGAIGGKLSLRLLAEGAKRIIIVDDLSSGYRDNVPEDERVTFVYGSVDDDEILYEIFSQEIEIIFHLAANFANQNSVDYPQKDLRVNGFGTLKLLEYAQRHNVLKFIYTSSSCVYGNKPGRLSVQDKEYSLDTPYAITKLLGERYVTFFHEYHRLNTVILRYFNSFGPGERPGKYRNVIPNFIWRAIHHQPLIITGTGEETRDFNYVSNTVDGTILGAQADHSDGKTYNIGSGIAVKIAELAAIINRLTGNPAPRKFVEKRKWDGIKFRKADIKETIQDLGYHPSIDLENHLRITCQWLVELKNRGLRIMDILA